MGIITPPAIQRVFIGIPIAENSQQQINELLKHIEISQRDAAWVLESNRHLTLAFMGNQPASVVKNLKRQFDQTYQQEAHFHYNLSTLKRFPNPGGRIIALLGEPVKPLNDLYLITLALLQSNNIECDQKVFRPHITLGRIKWPKQVKTDFDQRIKFHMQIDRVSLYQSKLTEAGPVYSTLQQTCLS